VVSAASINTQAPSFTLPKITQDGSLALSDYRGKVVYLDFWASWCAPCRVSFPLLNDLYKQQRSQGFEIIAVNLDEDEADLKRFLKLYQVDFILVRDKLSETPEKYQVEAMPSSFIIDKKGIIRYTHKGFKRADIKKIENKVKQLLKE